MGSVAHVPLRRRGVHRSWARMVYHSSVIAHRSHIHPSPLVFFFLYASAVTGDRDLAVLIQVIFYAVSGVFYACGFIACIWLLRNVDKYFSQTKVCPCGH